MAVYNQTFEQIAASLAHEVKNPLSLVKANIDLLELNDTEKSHEKNYKIMKRELERINELLLDFIEIAKPLQIVKEPFSLNAMLCELIDSVKEPYQKKINFVLNFEGHEFMLCADENKIRRVMLNVIKNSIESITEKESLESGNGNRQKGVIKINISSSDGFVEITVKDNGKGLTDEERQKISEPFFTTKRGGSGLGLFICKSALKEHGGVFKIEGEENKGCVVTILVPEKDKAAISLD